jgi:hypothetical protein
MLVAGALPHAVGLAAAAAETVFTFEHSKVTSEADNRKLRSDVLDPSASWSGNDLVRMLENLRVDCIRSHFNAFHF